MSSGVKVISGSLRHSAIHPSNESRPSQLEADKPIKICCIMIRKHRVSIQDYNCAIIDLAGYEPDNPVVHCDTPGKTSSTESSLS